MADEPAARVAVCQLVRKSRLYLITVHPLYRDSFDILASFIIEESAILVTLDALLSKLALLHKANRDPAEDSRGNIGKF